MNVRNLDNSFADGSRVGTVVHTVESGDPNYADLQSQSPQVRARQSLPCSDSHLMRGG